MKPKLLFLFLSTSLLLSGHLNAQLTSCGPNVPFFQVDLTGQPDGIWESPSHIRRDNCCGTTSPDRCTSFEVTLDAGAAMINLEIISGAVPSGALFYQIDCGPEIPVGEPICITGVVFVADKEVFNPNKKSQWTGRSYLDLYYMEKDEEGNWLNPELLKGDVSGPFHDGPATFSEAGDVVYFTRSNYIRRKIKTDDQNVSNLKIFRAELKDGKWRNLTEFPYNSDDYSVGHPSLSKDGKTLYFVSDMEGGFGGTDLYRCLLDEKENWGEPQNLGPIVNTPGNEMFPFINEDEAFQYSLDNEFNR